MNKSDLIAHFNNPDRLSQSDSEAMNTVLEDYPYFQAARAVQLKALHAQKSYKYNQALKRTAAHTIDRQVLFEYITSPVFLDLDRESPIDLEEIEVFDVETIQALHKKITDELEIEEKNKKENKDAKEKLESQVSDMLKIGQPIVFKKSEPHSFNEWMQLISKKPLRTEKQLDATSKKPQTNDKNELIERFIQSNPKIGTIDKSAKNVDIARTIIFLLLFEIYRCH